MERRNDINLMQVVLSLEVGGLERLVVETSILMRKQSINVEVCCFDDLGAFSEYLRDHGVEVTLLQKNLKHYDAFYPFRLSKVLRQKKIQIMHMHSGTFFLAVQAGILARTPVMVYTDHGRALIDTKTRIMEDRFSGLFVDKIISVSKELERYLIDRVKLPPKKIVTVINGINTDGFSPQPRSKALRNEFGLDDNCRVIGTVGRLDEVKDQLSMLKAFKIVHKTVPESVLMLIGDGPNKQQLLDFIRDNNLDKSVIITGNRKDVPELLNLFDVFVLSSLSEGTSISLLEAMSTGIPPVVTSVGGNITIVDNDVSGIIVEPQNIQQMADAISELLRDEEKRIKFGNNARNEVIVNYSIDKMVDNYISIYRDLLRKKKIISR